MWDTLALAVQQKERFSWAQRVRHDQFRGNFSGHGFTLVDKSDLSKIVMLLDPILK